MKKILIIGAGFLQQFVIKKANELNYYVFALDGNPNAIGFKYADEYKCIDIVDQEKCLKYAKEKKIDGVLTAATDYGVLTASYIAKKLNLPGLDYEVAKIIKNKYLVRKILCEKKVDDTNFPYEVESNTDFEKLSNKIDYPVMVKPCDGSGSRGASRVNDPKDLKKACIEAINNSLSCKAEIETFIFGKEYGVESLVENGEVHVLAIMKKEMTKPPYYAELGHIIPSGLSPILESKIKDYVKNAIKALKINIGSVNMDLLVTDDEKIHIVDIGARMGGNLIGSHIIPYGTGIDYMKMMLQLAVGENISFENQMNPKKVSSKILALRKGKIKCLPDFHAIANEYGVEIYEHLNIADIINEYHTNLDGCGYVLKAGEQANEVLLSVRNAKDKIDMSVIREK